MGAFLFMFICISYSIKTLWPELNGPYSNDIVSIFTLWLFHKKKPNYEMTIIQIDNFLKQYLMEETRKKVTLYVECEGH